MHVYPVDPHTSSYGLFKGPESETSLCSFTLVTLNAAGGLGYLFMFSC